MLPTDCSKAPTQLLHFAPYEAPLQPWSLPFFLFRLGWHYRGLPSVPLCAIFDR
jgi:hypothetical protein